MDIRSDVDYPASELSNFAAHPFVFDGEAAASMEGFLQSLKFDDPERARTVRRLRGVAARRKGWKRSAAWKEAGCLWWKGQPIDRFAVEYQLLLDGAFRAMFEQNEPARSALLATGDEELTHSIGRGDPSETILTTGEFCGRLMALRRDLRG